MDEHTSILIAAYGGAAFGVLGGLIGTFASIYNTDGPRERAFMIRCAVAAWLVVAVFLVGLSLTPFRWQFLLWIPYMVGLPLAIRVLNRRQAWIRQEESPGK